jgi:DNA-binding MarR family transcriptional regulator
MAEARKAQATRKSAQRRTGLVAVADGAPRAQTVPFDHEQHLFYWLTQVISRRDRHLTLALKPHRVRVPEWRVLGLLYSRRGLSMSEVADAAAIDPTTLTRTVAELVKKDLLVRLSRVGDKRVTRLALSAAGTRLVERILPIVFRLNAVACAGLPEGVAGLMKWALAEMRRSLDANLADAGATKVSAN